MATMTHLPRTYREAREVFARHARRPRGGGARRVRLGNNTYLYAYGDIPPLNSAARYAVRLHSTDVVTFHKSGMITLDTGGWYSVTTADRMHLFTDESVLVSYRWSGGDHRLVVSVADGRELVEPAIGEPFYRFTFRELVTSRDGAAVCLVPDTAGGVDTWKLDTRERRVGLVTPR